MNSPADSVEAIRSRLPNGGERFLVADAARAMEDFYRTERLDEYDDDSLVVVPGKYGKGSDRRFEIAFFRSFGLTTQLEVSLQFPVNVRCWFLPFSSDTCDSLADVDRFFVSIRSSRWFRRYSNLQAERCSVRWRGEEEMAEMLGTIVPKLMEALGPHL